METILFLNYFFLAISIIFLIFYISRLRKINAQDIVVEQQELKTNGFFLILFNDPFLGFTLLNVNTFSHTLSTIFALLFFTRMLYFVDVCFTRIHYESKEKFSKLPFWFTKYYIQFLFILLLTFYGLKDTYTFQNHASARNDEENDHANRGLMIATFVFFSILMVKFVFHAVNIILKIKEKQRRHVNLFLMLCIYFIILSVSFYRVRLSYIIDNGAAYFLFVSMANIIIFILQIGFLPTDKGIKDNQEFYQNYNKDGYNQELQSNPNQFQDMNRNDMLTDNQI